MYLLQYRMPTSRLDSLNHCFRVPQKSDLLLLALQDEADLRKGMKLVQSMLQLKGHTPKGHLMDLYQKH